MAFSKDDITGKAYIDANIFIYATEDYAPFTALARNCLTIIKEKELKTATSALTLCEVLTSPIKKGLIQLQEDYKFSLRNNPFLDLVPISEEILLKTAELRAFTNMKSPDSIHVATAILTECNIFITNDNGIILPEGMKKITL